MKEHDEPLHEVDFVPSFLDISVEIPEGELREVAMHDGSRIRLRKLARDYDPTSQINAIQALHEAAQKEEVLTGILYIATGQPTLMDMLNMDDQPLATLPESKVRPSPKALEEIMEELR